MSPYFFSRQGITINTKKRNSVYSIHVKLSTQRLHNYDTCNYAITQLKTSLYDVVKIISLLLRFSNLYTPGESTFSTSVDGLNIVIGFCQVESSGTIVKFLMI